MADTKVASILFKLSQPLQNPYNYCYFIAIAIFAFAFGTQHPTFFKNMGCASVIDTAKTIGVIKSDSVITGKLMDSATLEKYIQHKNDSLHKADLLKK